GQRPIVVLVTSSLPGEGKSAVATLLAASSAQAGQRTLVVDCDLRNRTISREFGSEQPGLSEVLTGTATLAASAHHHTATGCDIMPAGAASAKQTDLFASRAMSALLARLCDRYEYIVLDAPPLLSVVDALVLATMADKILVIVDSNRTKHDSIAEAFRL